MFEFHDEWAERALINSVLIKPDLMSKVLEIVKASDFYIEMHSQIFGVLASRVWTCHLQARSIGSCTLRCTGTPMLRYYSVMRSGPRGGGEG